MTVHDEMLPLEDENEVRLFSEIIDLEPERRKRLIEAVRAYELVMAHGEELFGDESDFS